MADQLQKSVVLLSQARGSVTYQRRISILTNFTDIISAKTLIRENKERLEEASDDELFGESFREKLQSTTKESKKASEYFENHNDNKKRSAFSFNSSSSSKNFQKQPFRGGPLSNQPRGRGRNAFVRRESSTNNNFKYPSNNRGKRGKQSKCSTLSQHISGPNMATNPDISSPSGKENFLTSVRKIPFCRENKILPGKLENINKRPKNFKCSEGMGNSTDTRTIPEKTYTQYKNEYNKYGACRPRGHRYAGKRGNQSSRTQNGSNCKQHISKAKTRGRIQTNNKLKRNELVHSIRAFQDGILKGSKKHVTPKRCDVQNRSKGRLFLSSPEHKVQEICSLPMERNIVRISLSSIWPGASPKDVYETNESPSVDATKDQY